MWCVKMRLPPPDYKCHIAAICPFLWKTSMAQLPKWKCCSLVSKVCLKYVVRFFFVNLIWGDLLVKGFAAVVFWQRQNVLNSTMSSLSEFQLLTGNQISLLSQNVMKPEVKQAHWVYVFLLDARYMVWGKTSYGSKKVKLQFWNSPHQKSKCVSCWPFRWLSPQTLSSWKSHP